MKPSEPTPPVTSAWEDHRDEQRRAWLELTPLQRLTWLSQAKDFCRKALAAKPLDDKKLGGK